MELEGIVKTGQSSRRKRRALVVGGSDASGRLLSDYEGLETARMARTQAQAAFTPNLLVTPRQQGSLGVLGGVSGTPLRTRHALYNSGDQKTPRENLRDKPLYSISDKRALKAGFMSLPRPENNFELLVPDDNLRLHRQLVGTGCIR